MCVQHLTGSHLHLDIARSEAVLTSSVARGETPGEGNGEVEMKNVA